MKKLLLILLVIFLSCEKEEPEPEISLVGKWKCYEIYNDGTYPRDFTFEFKDTYEAFFVDGTNYGKWVKDGNALYIYPHSGGSMSYRIVRLTETGLTLKRDITYYFIRL